MDDLISRTAAMTMPVLPKEHRDYISFELDDIYEQGWNECQSFIAKLPSAEPEIIRCKDCEHWDTSWQNDYAPNYHYCPLVDGTRRDDFYCADAEMRGERNE